MNALDNIVKDATEHERRQARDALDSLWNVVNALGGTHDGSAYEQGRHDAYEGVLHLIEQAGGMDPLRRASGDR